LPKSGIEEGLPQSVIWKLEGVAVQLAGCIFYKVCTAGIDDAAVKQRYLAIFLCAIHDKAVFLMV